MSDQNQPSETSKTPAKKRQWEPLKLTYLGHLSEVVQGGGGKLSIVGGDPGENRKPSGSG
jgi:hypothetical protein